MRTIEQVVTVTPDNQLIIQLPVDIPPGNHKVVLVIDEQVEPNAEAIAEPSTIEPEDPIFGLGKNPLPDSITDGAENHDRYIYTGL